MESLAQKWEDYEEAQKLSKHLKLCRSRYRNGFTKENKNQQVKVTEKQISVENFLTAITA